MHRRLVSRITAMLLVVPLVLRGDDRDCSQHDEKSQVVQATMPMEGHHHQHESPAPTPAPDEHHLPSNCCPAMNSCAGGAAVETATNDVAGTPWHDELPRYDATLLRSRVESPDPPPPKA